MRPPLLWVTVIGLAVVGGLIALARALGRSGAAAVDERQLAVHDDDLRRVAWLGSAEAARIA